MYVKWFDTVMFYYVILVNLVNVTFKIVKFTASSIPVRPNVAGNGTRKTDAGRRTLPGTLQEGHRGSEGQGKCRRDPGAARCKVFPSVARGYRLCYTREIPPGML
ncbi:unnamed protein product, partial [Staurois parvus]